MTKVVTWQTSDGALINLTAQQSRQLRAAGVWPKTDRGEEYCQVSRGMHVGETTFDGSGIDALIKRLT